MRTSANPTTLTTLTAVTLLTASEIKGRNRKLQHKENFDLVVIHKILRN